MSQYGLPIYDAEHLTAAKNVADFFEEAVTKDGEKSKAKAVSNWMLGDVMRLLNLKGRPLGKGPFTPGHLSELVGLIEAGTLSNTLAKTVLEESFESGKAPLEVVKEKGLSQISDTREPEGRGRLHEGQGHGVKVPCWAGDEADQGERQPCSGERTGEEGPGGPEV
jgi:aspartyl-tRNA(Asn)/glutamyl-tRNA(Gln) amidotransferase subunit B